MNMSSFGLPPANVSVPPHHNVSSFSCGRLLQPLLLPPLFAAEFVVALAANVLALRRLLLPPPPPLTRNWHAGSVLACNLAVSDLLYALTLPLLVVYYGLHKHWPFGDAVCKLERFMFACNLYASVFFVTGISAHRGVALARPFYARGHVTPSRARAASALAWLAVAALTAPVLRYASTRDGDGGGGRTECVARCDFGGDGDSAYFFYVVMRGTLGCFVPFVVTCASYCVVARVVWKNANVSRPEKRKVALMVACGVALYALSFVPYHVFQTYSLYLRTHGRPVCWVYDAYQVSKVMAALNMCLHPLLYMAVLDGVCRVACCRGGGGSADET